jgi:hypothetical protein
MKSNNQVYLQKLPSSKFYLDDLAEIEQVLRSACTSVDIYVGNRRLESLSELSAATNEERANLRLLGQGPRVSIEFNPRNVAIGLQEDNTLSRSIAPRIRQIIYAGKARLLILIFLSFITICLGLWLMIKGRGGLIIILLGWTWYMAIWWTDKRRNTVIRPILRSQETSYMERNKDELPFLILSAAFIAIILFLLTPAFFK